MKTVGLRQKTVSLQKASETSKPRQDGDAPRLNGGLLDARGGPKGVSGNVTRKGGHCDNVMMVCTPSSRGDDFQPARKPLPSPGQGATEPNIRAMRGPGGGSRGGGDFVMLGENPVDKPDFGIGSPGPIFKEQPDFGENRFPVKSIASLLQRLLQALPKPPVEAAPPQVGVTPPGEGMVSKWKPIKTGDGHADNVFKGPFIDSDPASGARPSVPVGSIETLLARLRDSDEQHKAKPAKFGHKPGESRTDNLLF